MAGWGGKRSGAGRPKGSRNGSTTTARERLGQLEADVVRSLFLLAKQARRYGELHLAADCLRDARRRTAEFLVREEPKPSPPKSEPPIPTQTAAPSVQAKPVPHGAAPRPREAAPPAVPSPRGARETATRGRPCPEPTWVRSEPEGRVHTEYDPYAAEQQDD
jgi:hypothetical protein